MKKISAEIGTGDNSLIVSSRNLVENVISKAKKHDIRWSEKQSVPIYPVQSKKINHKEKPLPSF